VNSVRIALIGAGVMGGSHSRRIKNIKELCITAVCDTDKEKADKLASENSCSAFTDHQVLLNSDVCDAVLIATPHYSHTVIGIDALKAGKHVLMEKPISVQKSDCERLIHAHTDKSLVFAAMFNQRTNPAYRKMKQLVDSGELGSLMRINWIITDWFRTQRYYDNGNWRATWGGEGGGVLLNQCPHQLDLLQWICGMPESVTAYCGIGKYHDIEVEDEVTAFLRYANGATGVFITSTGEAPGTNRFELTGTKGKIVIENNKINFIRNEVSCEKFLKESEKAFAMPDIWNVQIPVSGSGGQHEEILKNFADAILHGTEILAPAAEGIYSVELANAMLLSAIKNKEVTLPIDAAEYERFLKNMIKNSKYKKRTNPADVSGIDQSF